ncbi:MAG TPA: hypothetical protein VHG28_19560 [Longimicrobiaceae bacterium]|nr:hypothetical protein [Longimicrobiaceae bacterium]
MVEKYRGGEVPSARPTTLDAAIPGVLERYRTAMEANLLHEGVAAAYELVMAANAFVQETAPWKLAKDPERATELDAALASMVRVLAVAAVLFSPFMPARTADLWGRLGSGHATLPPLVEVAELSVAGWRVAAGEVLFPRADLPAKV